MQALTFTGQGGEYFKIWIVNVLLSIITLGFYYPWAKVRTRRYFYANMRYNDRQFNYHATGKQLFLSYVIALILLLTYVFVGQFFPPVGLLLFIVLAIGMPWVIWRSLMFNARMTSFSNVRFGFHGQLSTAYFIYLLLPILIGVAFYVPIIVAGFFVIGALQNADTETAQIGTMQIIGAFLPLIGMVLAGFIFLVAKKKGIDYRIGNLAFGQGKFSVNILKRKLLWIYLKAGLIIVVFGAVAVVAAKLLQFDPKALDAKMNDMENDPTLMLGLMLTYLVMIIFSLFIGAFVYSQKRRYVYANTVLDDNIHFSSSVSTGSLFYIIITNFLLTIFTLGLGKPWAAVRMMRYLVENTHTSGTADIDNYLTQKVEEQSALGEQIGDAFDVDIDMGF